ncbi:MULTISPECIES: hypothetical protein [unclassified Aeromicrobium]|uniref:hypothetical protein n=1 Tax=unclassified Aeromicrobium TaxID=2633570 RepID=UPI00396B41EA
MKSMTRAALVAVIALVASLLMAPAGAAARVAADPVTISGRITPQAFDLESFAMRSPIEVRALAKVGGAWETVGYAATRSAYGPADGVELDGSFVLRVAAGHPVVRLKFAQRRCEDQYDDCHHDAPDVLTSYWNGTASGALTLADARDIALDSGPVTDADITLRRAPKLRPETSPSVAGVASPGRVLTARPGTYAPGATSATYVWWYGNHDGSGDGEYDRQVGTGPTFRPTAGMLGGSLRLEVLPARLGHEAPTVISDYVRVTSRSSIAAKAKPAKRRATVTITIKAPGVATSRVHGKASIYAKGKRITTVTVKNGKATFKISKQKRGKRTYTVRYSGNRIISSSTTSLKIAIR